MLELKNISKSYKNKKVLVDINVTIESGEIISLLGPSGCGKTTLLNIILGLVDPTAGQLVYNGQDISKQSMQERGFNIVFQDSDKVIIINEGTVAQFGTPHEIVTAPKNQFVEDFILRQLHIKRHNIYQLFGETYA